jgi:GNAT superfamily N-acetyltransferase
VIPGDLGRAVVVRVAGAADSDTLASLRSLWFGGDGQDHELGEQMARWLAAEGDRRTTFLATVGDAPAGMASLFEYRRMPRPGRPDSRWGYVSNMFVREELRNRGIGTALLTAVTAAADERGYARLVLSPSPGSVDFYRRAGFRSPEEAAGDDRLLVRPGA